MIEAYCFFFFYILLHLKCISLNKIAIVETIYKKLHMYTIDVHILFKSLCV